VKLCVPGEAENSEHQSDLFSCLFKCQHHTLRGALLSSLAVTTSCPGCLCKALGSGMWCVALAGLWGSQCLPATPGIAPARVHCSLDAARECQSRCLPSAATGPCQHAHPPSVLGLCHLSILKDTHTGEPLLSHGTISLRKLHLNGRQSGGRRAIAEP
jgi:hypothetical protein